MALELHDGDIYIVDCSLRNKTDTAQLHGTTGERRVVYDNFYCSLKLIFTSSDDICLQLIRSDDGGFNAFKEFSVGGS